VVEEDGTAGALALRQRAVARGPIAGRRVREHLWKRVRWDELLKEEALLAARLLQGAEIELLPMQSLFEATTRMSIEFDHAAYDCVYVALAIDNKC
jgi:predicted nucleic acid-binding protein